MAADMIIMLLIMVALCGVAQWLTHQRVKTLEARVWLIEKLKREELDRLFERLSERNSD